MAKIRTVYFKVEDMQKAKEFWSGFLEQEPSKNAECWMEYQLENIRLGFLPREENDQFQGCNAAIMFEYDEEIFVSVLDHAKSLGARVVLDSLDDPALRSVVVADPNGHEFEMGIKGTHH